MRNQLAFIPQNISSISNVSLHKKTANQQEIQYSLADSTDNLIEQILRQRTQRIQKEEEKGQMGSGNENGKEMQEQIKEIGEIGSVQDHKYRQSNRTSRSKNSIHAVIPQLNESFASKQQNSSKKSSLKSNIPHTNLHHQQHFIKHTHHNNSEDRLQQLQDETNQKMRLQVRKDNEENKVGLKSNVSELKKIDNDKSYSLEFIDKSDEEIIKSLKKSQKKSQKVINYSDQSEGKNEQKHKINENKSIHTNQAKSQKMINDGHLQNITIQFNQKENHNKSSQSSNYNSSHIKQAQFQNDKKSEIQRFNSMFKKKNIQESYQFVPQGKNKDENELVQSITQRLNMFQPNILHHIQENQKNNQSSFSSIAKQSKKQVIKKENIFKRHDFSEDSNHVDISHGNSRQINDFMRIKQVQQQYQTDYSRISRNDKILSHEYESNIKLLIHQTEELLQFYKMNILEEQRKQVRKQVMEAQIYNNRLKVYLRNGCFSKRFNYIAPIPQNNDQPLEFKSKFTLKQELRERLCQLSNEIQEQRKTSSQHQQRLNVLTKYYNYMKSKNIIDNQQITMIYQYNSQLQMYLSQLDQFINGDQSSISGSLANGNHSQTTSTKGFKFNSKAFGQQKLSRTKSPQKKNEFIKEKKQDIMTPLYQYNLLKIKTQISKQMMVETQMYNEGRAKRIRDENKLMKKELSFVDQEIQHFDKSFAEQIKNYEESCKPKISYQSFQAFVEPETPYSKSPFNRDFHGNNKGQNNINIYRPDYTKNSSSRKLHLSPNSVSKSKYSIKRPDHPFNMPKSSNQISLSHNFTLTTLQENSNTQISFFRRSNMNINVTPKKLKQSKSQRKLSLIREIPNKKGPDNSRKSNVSSSKSIESHSKRLLRFSNHESPLHKTNRKRDSQQDKHHTHYYTSKKSVQSEYYVGSLDISDDR